MQMMSNSVKTAIASAVLLLAATSAHAELTTYTSQAAYLAAVGTTSVDSFDGLGPESLNGFDGPVTFTAGAISYDASVGPISNMFYGASDNDVDYWLSTNNRTDTVTFSNFSTDIAGAGGFFFGSDVFGFSNPAASITISATDSLGGTLSYTITAPTVNSFVGFVSSANLTSLSFTVGDQAGVWPTVNDLHLSVAAVPEPETYGMMLAGLGLLGFAARRKQRKS